MISRLYKEDRVFIDGRNDMSSEQILDDDSAIRNADSNCQELVIRYGVEAILLPPNAAVVRGPAKEAGCREAYRDGDHGLLLTRPAATS